MPCSVSSEHVAVEHGWVEVWVFDSLKRKPYALPRGKDSSYAKILIADSLLQLHVAKMAKERTVLRLSASIS